MTLRAVIPMLFVPAVLTAQNGGGHGANHPTAPPMVQAALRAGPIQIDGRLDDAPWQTVQPATDFRQSMPHEGQPATQRTEIRFLFDGDALYVGARMYDSLGAAGVRTRLVRRDQLGGEADQLDIILDTFHDHLGRTRFTVNPSGVKADAYGPGGAGEDASWDPVYELATSVDGEGWIAELRIPLSQLRFPTDSAQTWGLQLVRFASRLNERSHWAWWPNRESGGPFRYGHLEGLELGTPPRGLEVLPYVVAQQTRLGRINSSNPFQREREAVTRLGVDLTYRVTTNLTLSATVNPDFGQVEVDPAVVNLSAFETFFPERRPFFIEGAGLFRFGGLNCFSCSNASGLSVLHSRRIGRPPQGSAVAFAQGPYADVPDNTAILGAVKLTGRTPGGWSIGVLNAVTARERALTAIDSVTTRDIEVEPFTNYFAGRLARDYRGGNTQVRLMATSVVRDLRDSALSDRLNRHSEVVGVETDMWFGRRTWRLMSYVALSNISGDTGAIWRAQLSSARYFQRPDRDHGGNGLFTDSLDPRLTAMRGYAAYTRLSKESGNWIGEGQVNVRSPGFEANDLAFNTRMDFIWFNGNVRRRWTRPTSWYRWLQVGAGGQHEVNYDGDVVGAPQVSASWFWELTNYWQTGMYGHVRPERGDERLTRGGPLVNRPREYFVNWFGNSDFRRKVVISADGWVARNADDGLEVGGGTSVRLQPATNVTLVVGPRWSHFISRSQFVTSVADTVRTAFYGRRYVFADLDQTTISMDTRVSWTFSPRLSFEMYLQPLIASAGFRAYKEFVRPRSAAKMVYGRDVGTIAFDTTAAGATDSTRYRIDPDGAGPAAAFSVTRPDFTLRSLRGNAIVRWEFRPGSTLYFVWTQSRASQLARGTMRMGPDTDALLSAPADNVFLVKMSWWLGL